MSNRMHNLYTVLPLYIRLSCEKEFGNYLKLEEVLGQSIVLRYKQKYKPRAVQTPHHRMAATIQISIVAYFLHHFQCISFPC